MFYSHLHICCSSVTTGPSYPAIQSMMFNLSINDQSLISTALREVGGRSGIKNMQQTRRPAWWRCPCLVIVPRFVFLFGHRSSVCIPTGHRTFRARQPANYALDPCLAISSTTTPMVNSPTYPLKDAVKSTSSPAVPTRRQLGRIR